MIVPIYFICGSIFLYFGCIIDFQVIPQVTVMVVEDSPTHQKIVEDPKYKWTVD